MINVYSKNNLDFTKNGDATLQPIRCDLSMEINGAWSLEIEVPYDKEGKWEYLVEGSIIIADVDCIRELSNKKQRFRVYDYIKGISSLTAIAFPVAMESTHDAPIENVVITNKTGAQAMTQLQAFTNKYTLYSNIANTGSTALSNTNVNSAIASGKDDCFIKIWGGEICYDNLKFSVLNRLGENQAEKHPVIYGRNMTAISYEKDDSGLITRLYPISQDGIRLSYDGKSYVDSPKIHDYPIVHSRFIQAPYKLVIDDISNGSQTAVLTRSIQSQISTLVNTLSHSVYNSAVANKVEPEYIKKIRSDIVEAVQDMATANIYHADMNKIMRASIKSSMEWLKDVSKPTWTWHDAGNDAWWYGASESSRAVSEYVYIDRIWRYFGDNAYWQRPKDDDSKKWDWIQEASGYRYGNNEKYYAQKTYVYITMNGQMKEYWFDEDGYWDGSDDTDSSYAWHGSGTSADPWWFGEEGATSEDTNKFLHGGWWFIDGTYYYFDEYGYYDGTTKFENYQWDWVETSNSKWWFGNDANHNFARVYVTNQWLKVGGDWYRFNGDGYAIGGTALETEVINLFKTGMAQLKTTCEALNTQAYTLLYNLMKGYCDRSYAYQGIDVPTVTITVNMVDLSQTIEYKDYKNLEKVCLGDNVKCVDYEHGISTTERVVSITYDCIRRYNSEVTIGVAESTVADKLGVNAGGGNASGGFDTSVIESTLTNHTNELARLESAKQDKLTAGDNIEIINNVISATGGGGQGLQYFVETPNSLYGRSEVDIMQDPAFVFDHQVSVTFRAQGGTHTWSTQAGVTTGIAETHVIRSLSANTWNGIFQISDNPSDLSIYYKFVKDNWWDVDSEGTMTWDNCPNAMLYPCSSSINAYGFKDTFEVDGKTYYIMTIGSNQIPFTTEQIGTYASSTLYLPSYNGHAENPDRPDNGYYETLGEFGDYLLSQSEDTYYNGLSRSGRLAFFAGGEDENGTDAPIKIYADGTAEGLVTKHDFDNADFTGATSSENGAHGLVPQPLIADKDKFLKGDGTWAEETDAIEELTDVNLTSVADGQILKYNSTTQKWENANESGGGSDVEANPTDPATDTLNTIGIDGTVYNIAGGGGGESSSGVYVEEELYNATVTSFANISLDKSLLDYDMVVIYSDWDYTFNYDHIFSGTVFTKEQLKDRAGTTNRIIALVDNSHLAQYTLSADGKTLTAFSNSGATNIRRIVGIKTSGDYYSPVIYSTEEREIGVWTNNKPLYQKTFNGSWTLRGTSWSNTIVTIANAELKDVTCLDTDWQSMGVNGNIDSSGNLTLFNLRNTTLTARAVTVWYTKTTDTAGSGSYNTLGVPTVHYTTDEQVIGTWVDNKPLYQKTIVLPSEITVSNTNWTSTGITASSLDIETYVRCSAQNSSGTCWDAINVATINSNISLTAWRNGDTIGVKIFTIQYTKTTDV